MKRRGHSLGVAMVILSLSATQGGRAQLLAEPSPLFSTVRTSFPTSHYTPHGYIDNPYHSMVFNRSGVIRSVPPLGFGYWRAEFKGSYGEGIRDHQNYLALLQMSLKVDTAVIVTTEDFIRQSIELYSEYHTKSMVSYDCPVSGLRISMKYFLPRENSICNVVEMLNTTGVEKEVVLSATHMYQIGALKWWGSNGLVSRYEPQDDAAISKIWAYGDIFFLGGDLQSVAHTVAASGKDWERWVRNSDTLSSPTTSLMGKGPMYATLRFVVRIPPRGFRRLFVFLSRGKNEQWARREFNSAKAESESLLTRRLLEDNEFWARCPILAGDWPDAWKHGWVYDFETLRMNVRRPIGIFKHPWDGMQVHSPRVVLGETSMDMMAMSYADDSLAREVIFGTFSDAQVPNIPCAREDGSVNMISADGSECGTAPMWGFPFHVIKSIFLSTGDTAWVEKLYPRLKAYIDWWLQHRTDSDGWLHCDNSWESGQDGSRRFLVAEHNEGAPATFVRTVDVEASMAEAMNTMEYYAALFGKGGDEREWSKLAAQRAKNTREMFVDNWYRDIDARNRTPIILKDHYDVMMFAPLTCGVATASQMAAVRPMFRFFLTNISRTIQWPPAMFAFTEAAWNASERTVAGEVVALTADRVYRRTDMRTVLYQDSLFSYRIPGVANEFWPVRDQPAGGENYGWGATLPLYILRNIVGFRESEKLTAPEFIIAPNLPKSLAVAGKNYSVRNLHYRDIRFDVTYELEKTGRVKVSIDSRSQRAYGLSVRNDKGGELLSIKEPLAVRHFSFTALNGSLNYLTYY